MEETITICMDNRDASLVEKLFDITDDPGYTIIKRIDRDNGYVFMEIMFSSPVVMWFLAKKVYLNTTHEDEMNKFISNIKKI